MGWLKNKLRAWLVEPAPPKRTIQAIVNRQPTEVFVTGVVGMRLAGSFVRNGKSSIVLVGEGQAIDREAYWALWKVLGGRAKWADGTDFKPSGA
jgi:hypothetical protein